MFQSPTKMGAKVGDRCVLVNPREVEEIMKMVPRGPTHNHQGNLHETRQEIQCRSMLHPNHRNIHYDRRQRHPRIHKGRKREPHPLLTHVESRRASKRKVSRRSGSTQKITRRGRPQNHPESKKYFVENYQNHQV